MKNSFIAGLVTVLASLSANATLYVREAKSSEVWKTWICTARTLQTPGKAVLELKFLPKGKVDCKGETLNITVPVATYADADAIYQHMTNLTGTISGTGVTLVYSAEGGNLTFLGLASTLYTKD